MIKIIRFCVENNFSALFMHLHSLQQAANIPPTNRLATLIYCINNTNIWQSQSVPQFHNRSICNIPSTVPNFPRVTSQSEFWSRQLHGNIPRSQGKDLTRYYLSRVWPSLLQIHISSLTLFISGICAKLLISATLSTPYLSALHNRPPPNIIHTFAQTPYAFSNQDQASSHIN